MTSETSGTWNSPLQAFPIPPPCLPSWYTWNKENFQGFFGHLYPKTSLSGPEPAYPARKTRFTVMRTPLSSTSLFQLELSLTSTSTWLVLFQLAKDTHIFSPRWTEPPEGRMQFHWPQPSAESCAQALIDTWISRFGVRSTLTSDRGAQFTSSLWSRGCSTLGINHILTTSYHPQRVIV